MTFLGPEMKNACFYGDEILFLEIPLSEFYDNPSFLKAWASLRTETG